MEEKLCPSCEEPVIEKVPGCPLACMSPRCKAYKRLPVVNIQHKPVIWILGGPGCGKGTQCTMIKEKYGYCHLSTGDLLRAEVAMGSERAKCLETIMKRGGLVPNDIVLDLVYEEIKRQEPTAKGFLIDGYPRERNQGAAFEKAIAPASAIIYFETTPETLLSRLETRAATAKVRRIDDTSSAFKLRINTFLAYNQPILELYADKIFRISADGNKDDIFREVVKCLDPIASKTKAAWDASSPAAVGDPKAAPVSASEQEAK